MDTMHIPLSFLPFENLQALVEHLNQTTVVGRQPRQAFVVEGYPVSFVMSRDPRSPWHHNASMDIVPVKVTPTSSLIAILEENDRLKKELATAHRRLEVICQALKAIDPGQDACYKGA